MKFSVTRIEHGDAYIVQLEMDVCDLVEAKLTPSDMAVLEECARGESISDRLLAVHTIAKRVEEAIQQQGNQLND